LDAFRIALDRHPDAHLVVVGEGPEGASLRAASRRDEAAARHVHWLGQRHDVPALLKAADVLVLPSRWEGMPNVILEAMAAGRPVVATAVEGSRELVVPGRTGWLAAPEDVESLAGALGEALA